MTEKKGTNKFCKTLQRKVKIEQHGYPLQTGSEFDCSLMHFFQIIVTLYLNEKYKYIYTVKPASNALDIDHTFYIKYGDIL